MCSMLSMCCGCGCGIPSRICTLIGLGMLVVGFLCVSSFLYTNPLIVEIKYDVAIMSQTWKQERTVFVTEEEQNTTSSVLGISISQKRRVSDDTTLAHGAYQFRDATHGLISFMGMLAVFCGLTGFLPEMTAVIPCSRCVTRINLLGLAIICPIMALVYLADIWTDIDNFKENRTGMTPNGVEEEKVGPAIGTLFFGTGLYGAALIWLIIFYIPEGKSQVAPAGAPVMVVMQAPAPQPAVNNVNVTVNANMAAEEKEENANMAAEEMEVAKA